MMRNQLLFENFGCKSCRTALLMNLIGLTAGVLCALFIWFWVKDEGRLNRGQEKNRPLYEVIDLGKVDAPRPMMALFDATPSASML